MTAATLPALAARSVGHAFVGESPASMSAAAQVDDLLANGQLPDKSTFDQSQAWQLRQALQFNDRSDKTAANKKRYLARLGVDMLTRGIIGGVVGGVLLSTAAASMALPVAAMAAVGAGIGAFSAWYKLHRHEQGQVLIHHDGQERKTRFHLQAWNYPQTPQELRTLLMSQNWLGDRISASPRPDVSTLPVDADRLKALTPALSTLQELDADRRLVAHLGNRSTYGHDVLDLVDADAARKLMAAGRAVYVVSGEGTQDVSHRLEISARTPAPGGLHLEAHDYTERQFKYHLTPVTSVQDVASIEQGEGVPQGMVGVYEHAPEVSVPVYRQAQEDDSTKVAKTWSHHRSDFEQAEASDVARGEKVGTATTYHMNFRDIFMLLGGCVGMAVAIGFTGPGVPGPALLGLVGMGFLGRVLGEKLSYSRFGTIGRQDN